MSVLARHRGESFGKRGYAVAIAEGEHASVLARLVVRRDDRLECRRKQSSRVAACRDRFAMAVAFREKFAHLVYLAERRRAIARHEHRIEEHGRSCRKGLRRIDASAALCGNIALPRRDDFGACADSGQLRAHRVQALLVKALGDEHRDLCTLGTRRTPRHRQRGRRGGGCTISRLCVRLGSASCGDFARQRAVYLCQKIDRALPDVHIFAFAQLETERVDDMPPLPIAHAVVKQRRLRVEVEEGICPVASDRALYDALVVAEPVARAAVGVRLTVLQRVAEIGGRALVDRHAVHAVTLIVVDRGDRPVDGQFVEVGSAQPRQLRVEIGKQPALQHRVVAQLYPRHEIGGTERDLLRLGKEVGDVSVERELAERLDRDQLFRPQLCAIEHVEVEFEFVFGVEHLHAELPLGIVAVLDRLPKVAAIEIGVFAGDLLRLVPHERLHALQTLPMQFDELVLPVCIDEFEGVDAEAVHHPVRPRDRSVRHQPHHIVRAFVVARDEVPKGVVRRLRLRDLVVGLGFERVDEVGEFDRVLHKEHGHVVAHDVVVALFGVEFDRKTAYIPDRVGRAAKARDRRKAHKHRRLLALCVQKRRLCQRARVAVRNEHAVSARAARVNYPLGYALVIEMRQLFTKHKVLNERRTALPRPLHLLIVDDRRALIGRHRSPAVRHPRRVYLLYLRVGLVARNYPCHRQYLLV